MLLAAALASACGSSEQSARVRTARSSAEADPSKGHPIVRGPAADTNTSPFAGRPSAAATPAGPSTRAPVPPAHPVPAAFRPAPGAPSDAEVRSQLSQLSTLQRQEHQRALSAAAASLAGLLPWSLEPKSGIQVSVASVFRDYGLGLACGGVLGRSQLGVAHKTAPCGTLITFVYGGRAITVPVIDRGPYIAGREWDLTGATAAALGFPGLGQIQWSLAG